MVHFQLTTRPTPKAPSPARLSVDFTTRLTSEARSPARLSVDFTTRLTSEARSPARLSVDFTTRITSKAPSPARLTVASDGTPLTARLSAHASFPALPAPGRLAQSPARVA